MATKLKSSQWKPHPPTEKVGKLCYHSCTTESDLPVRDVLHGSTEPNYETATYNWYQCCNQPSVRTAVRDGLSHILFVTKYKRTNSCYVGRYFIVGYYEIGWTAEVNGHIAIRAKNLCFVPVKHAYEITAKRWRCIKPDSKTPCLINLRQATQRISGNLLDEIMQHLDKYNRVDDYLIEVERLKIASTVQTKTKCSQYNDCETPRRCTSPSQKDGHRPRSAGSQ